MFTTTTSTIRTTFRRIGVPIAAGALVLAACGGSDDGDADGGDDGSAADVAQDSDAGSGDAGSDGSDSDSDAAPADGDASDDVSGSGSNDEAQQSLDDAGVDLDLDALEETANALSTGSGGGVVSIDGQPYEFGAEICIAQGPSFIAEGLGETPDGTPAWISVSYANDFDFDGDGVNEESIDVFVEVGKTELFGSGADDAPDWSASNMGGLAGPGVETITATLDGNSISGGGPINDFNGVAIPFGETLPMTFEASCS